MTSELEKKFFNTFGIELSDNFIGCKNGMAFYTYDCDRMVCYPKSSSRL